MAKSSAHKKRALCFDRILPRNLRGRRPPGHRTGLEAALEIRTMWMNGSTIRVSFMNGTTAEQNRVKQFAPGWTAHANLKFQFTNSPDTEIRVAFNPDGNWSAVGQDCLKEDSSLPTMNLEDSDEGTILHEFGHAIGLIHEHQSPAGGIQWNEPNVISDLSGPPNNWDIKTIQGNLFDKYDHNQIRGTELDKKSIMMYAIPARWTLNGYSVDPNNDLSKKDKDFIQSTFVYPPPAAAGAVQLPVADLSPTAADIGKPGEEDLFTFAAPRDGRYTIETEGGTDVVMSLYGPDNPALFVDQDDDGGSGFNARIVANLRAGKYYVQVRHYYSSDGTGSYGIRVVR